MPSPSVIRQFIKYGIVGASNTAIAIGTYVVLYKVVGLHYLLASLIGFVLGATNSYMLNRHWTFEAAQMSHGTSAPRFALVQGCAGATNELLLYLLVHDEKLPKTPAQVIVTASIVAITFGINRAWSFSHPPATPP